MWPIYVTINELPFKQRNQHTLLCGLYVGKKDPNQLIYLKPFVQEANKLATEGFDWLHKGDKMKSKVIPLCGVLDSVARCQVLNMQTFHAFFGCTYCYQQQQRTIPRKRRFDMLGEAFDERSPKSARMDAFQAFERRNETKIEDRSYRGVKGPSVLMELMYFNLIWGLPIDYMHAVLLGIVKTHMKFLFESNRKKMWVNVSDRVALDDILTSIDRHLLNIKRPSCITRVPRSIKMWKNWKASEWRTWLLFYCIPCLDGLLQEKYIVHLHCAISLLLQKSIEMEDINEAHELLLIYGALFQKYFDAKDTIYNLHLLTHIKKCVLNFGPLWTHNAFGYEGQNRHLLQLYTSPSNVLLQITRRFILYSSMPSLFHKLVTSFNTAEFSEVLLDRKLVSFVRSGNAVLIGQGKQPCLTAEEKDKLNAMYGSSSSLVAFDRMLYKGVRYTTTTFAKGKQNNDSFAVYGKNVAKISHINKLDSDSIIVLGRLVTKAKAYIVTDSKVTITHVRRVKRLDTLICVPVTNIQNPGIFIEPEEGCMYISPMPFGSHGD